jgi:hypothetical protein
MISRRSADSVATCYAQSFVRIVRTSTTHYVQNADLYDFLYINDHEPWLCNLVNRTHTQRDLKESLMQLHTGETLSELLPGWSWEEKRVYFPSRI